MNKIEILDNKKVKIFFDDSDDFEKFKNHLSFKIAGVEYTKAYKAGNWDGITYMVNAKKEFPIGLLDRAKNYLKNNKIDYSIQDNRAPIKNSNSLDISNRLKELEMPPRDYQIRASEIIDKSNFGIIRAATGAGKTLIAALIAARINKPTIIYVIGLDLLNQFFDFFSKVFDEEIGYIGNGTCNIKRINIASVWTIGKALDIQLDDLTFDDEIDEEKFQESNKYKIISLLKDTKVHLLDECHVATATTIRSIHKVIEPEYFYGLSGTPFREDNSDLLIEGILGPKLIDISASELIDKGVLAQPIIKFIEVPKEKISGPYQTIYKNYIIENHIRNNLILENTLKLIEKGYKVLVLFKNIKHGKILSNIFKNNNIKYKILSGNDSLDKREDVKKAIYNGEIDVILASTIFDIGVDIKCLSALVLAGGGKSYVKALQRIGRVIRSYPGKKFAAIVDFYDDIKYLKAHSTERCKIYMTEDGFKVIPAPGMKV
jgi:superfamily II DNA or RNA helicase